MHFKPAATVEFWIGADTRFGKRGDRGTRSAPMRPPPRRFNVSGHPKCTTSGRVKVYHPGDRPEGGCMPGKPESLPPAWPMYSRCKHNRQSSRSTPRDDRSDRSPVIWASIATPSAATSSTNPTLQTVPPTRPPALIQSVPPRPSARPGHFRSASPMRRGSAAGLSPASPPSASSRTCAPSSPSRAPTNPSNASSVPSRPPNPTASGASRSNPARRLRSTSASVHRSPATMDASVAPGSSASS